MTIKRETVKLKRLERRKWQFEDEEPKCVELAVLDYYKAQGWKGYFTEKEDPYSIICFVVGWGDWSARKPKAVSTVYDLLSSVGYKGTINNIELATPERLMHNLNISTKYAQNYYVLQSLVGLNDDDLRDSFAFLLSYFEAVGAEGLASKVTTYWPEERIANYRAIHKYDRKIWRWSYENKIPPPSRFSEALHYRDGYEDRLLGLKETPEFVRQHFDEKEVVKCDRIRKLAELELERWKKLKSFATLDLELWKDRELAYVEVKAPGDKLFQQQINALSKYEERGVAAWVVDVVQG